MTKEEKLKSIILFVVFVIIGTCFWVIPYFI
jgi:hypothetical protein